MVLVYLYMTHACITINDTWKCASQFPVFGYDNIINQPFLSHPFVYVHIMWRSALYTANVSGSQKYRETAVVRRKCVQYICEICCYTHKRLISVGEWLLLTGTAAKLRLSEPRQTAVQVTSQNSINTSIDVTGRSLYCALIAVACSRWWSILLSGGELSSVYVRQVSPPRLPCFGGAVQARWHAQ